MMLHLAILALNACTVLTKNDVRAVQGAAFVSTKLTTSAGITRCFYQLPSFVDSVSVDLMPKGGRAFWEQRVEEREDPGEEKEKPREIEGIGDEALWIASHVGGSLYVRSGDAMLRVSVGGKGTDAEKLVKSKRLATRALRRLRR